MRDAVPKVVYIYPFFPHYREPVFTQIINSPNQQVVLVGDDKAFDSTIKPWIPPDSCEYVVAPCRKLYRSILWQHKVIGQCLRKDIDIAVIHAGTHWPAMWIGAIAAKLTGKKVYNWTHGWTCPPKGIKGRVRHLLYRIFDGFLLYGHAAKIHGINDGFDPDRLYVIYNSLDYDKQQAVRDSIQEAEPEKVFADLFDNPSLPTVMCSSRLVPVRKLNVLLAAAGILKEKGTPVNVFILGDGPERPALEQISKDLMISAHFFGACYDEAVLARFIMASRLMISPGAIGLAATHSLAYGTPVITHNNPDNHGPEWETIIPGVTGDFFEENNPDDLAAIITNWTQGSTKSPDVTRRCIKYVDRFWNARFQLRAIERALMGHPADDLFWAKEPKI